MRKRKSQASTTVPSDAPTPEWRALEQMVARLERVLGEDADIKSPDHIPDVHTGRKREVDVSIRIKAGSTPILVIIECRKRKKVSDVTWIEQVAQKRSSVGADKAVVIGELSKEAKLKAAALQIAVRALDETSEAELIANWFPTVFCEVFCRTQVVGPTDLALDPRPGMMNAKALQRWIAEKTAQGMRTETASIFIHNAQPIRALHLGEVFQRELRSTHTIWEEVPDDGSSITRPVELVLASFVPPDTLTLVNPQSFYFMKAGAQKILIESIKTTVRFWKEKTPDRIASAASRYRSEHETHVNSGYFKVSTGTLGIHHRKDGRVVAELIPNPTVEASQRT